MADGEASGPRSGSSRQTIAAVVLAAGGGSRYRGPTHKLLADLHGRPVVSWSIEAALGAGLDETIVVTGAIDLSDVVPGQVTVLENPGWADGLATSLAVGLDWCARQGRRAAVIGLGDQPLVRTSAWTAVAAADHAPIVVATYGGQRRNPVRLRQDVWPLLPSSGDEGARTLMRSRPELVGEVACDGEPVDIDTWEDLERWS
ncbi:MAG: nucleotidyltransferase family protein [Acidimicrobiales bacterium]|nr:nucleotidyltransferase family protein [Acidimicrobiales bacterium]MBO0886295.1 nucleotidyltransferase family protein [Acidimicrobiales bacterium]